MTGSRSKLGPNSNIQFLAEFSGNLRHIVKNVAYTDHTFPYLSKNHLPLVENIYQLAAILNFSFFTKKFIQPPFFFKMIQNFVFRFFSKFPRSSRAIFLNFDLVSWQLPFKVLNNCKIN